MGADGQEWSATGDTALQQRTAVGGPQLENLQGNHRSNRKRRSQQLHGHTQGPDTMIHPPSKAVPSPKPLFPWATFAFLYQIHRDDRVDSSKIVMLKNKMASDTESETVRNGKEKTREAEARGFGGGEKPQVEKYQAREEWKPGAGCGSDREIG